MANNLQSNTSGLDIPISRAQRLLYKRINSLNSEIDINGFGRVYINPRNQKKVLETYVGNDEYEDVLRSDDSRFFFVLNPEINIPDAITANVGVVFMVNLEELYSTKERLDEQFRGLCLNVLEDTQLKPKKISIGTNYLKRYLANNFDNTSFEFEDIQPLHVFVIETEVNYNFKNCI